MTYDEPTPPAHVYVLPDGIAVRAYGRIVADSGEDITESYIGESDGSPPGR
jgi:hypothetical protein